MEQRTSERHFGASCINHLLREAHLKTELLQRMHGLGMAPRNSNIAVIKKLSLWPRKTLLKLQRLFSQFTSAAL